MLILLVEDDDDLRAVLAEALADKGFSVASARTAEEALRRLQDGLVPRVVIIDLMLPGLTMEAFLATKQADERIASTPIFVVSGHPDAEATSTQLGVQGFFRKPLDLDLLVAALSNV